MDAKQKALKDVAIAFAKFLDEDCVRSGMGWCLDECLEDYVDTEFKLDELYDYWREKIISKSAGI